MKNLKYSPAWNFLEFFFGGLLLFWVLFFASIPLTILFMRLDYLLAIFGISLLLSALFGIFMDKIYMNDRF